ncbi:hypothetical protein DSO57_1020196 [Entomophthora muscae]|uniref:Uncharacterized protein n=1 Tax=Entomophthora muscae TaxID=34485 RepID=A0ACC2SGW9_9FUNG|nr:hypothetical protein DSO57_1020196 [Entomophthora muscae]
MKRVSSLESYISILLLKTQESNPGPHGALCTNQDEQGPANLPSCRLKLTKFPTTLQISEGDSLYGDQITTKCVPPRIQTYSKGFACQKEIKTRSVIDPTNKHQQLQTPSLKLAIQLDDSDNRSNGTKPCHYCLLQLVKPEFSALKILP